MSIYADVGGGSVVNRTRNSLARIPLRWMVRQCFVAGTGIMFHKDTFFKIGLDPNSLYPDILPRPPMILQNPSIHTIPVPKPGVVKNDRKAVVYTDGDGFINEAEEDLADALSPMYDQLKLARYWWLLEMIPQTIHYQCSRTENVKHKIVYVDSHFVVSLCVNGYSSPPHPSYSDLIGVILVMRPCNWRRESRYTEVSKFEWKPKEYLVWNRIRSMSPEWCLKSTLHGSTSK